MVERAKPPTGWWWIELGFDADTVTFPAWDSLKDMQRQSYDDAMPAKLARRCTANLQKDLHRSWDSAACTGHSRPPHADTALFNTVAAACVTLKLKYTQGMNLVAAAILLGCDFSVPTAYAVMCTLLADAGLQAIYAANVPTLDMYIECWRVYMQRYAPQVDRRLCQVMVTAGGFPRFVAVELMSAMFITVGKLPFVLAVIDLLLWCEAPHGILPDSTLQEENLRGVITASYSSSSSKATTPSAAASAGAPATPAGLPAAREALAQGVASRSSSGSAAATPAATGAELDPSAATAAAPPATPAAGSNRKLSFKSPVAANMLSPALAWLKGSSRSAHGADQGPASRVLTSPAWTSHAKPMHHTHFAAQALVTSTSMDNVLLRVATALFIQAHVEHELLHLHDEEFFTAYKDSLRQVDAVSVLLRATLLPPAQVNVLACLAQGKRDALPDDFVLGVRMVLQRAGQAQFAPLHAMPLTSALSRPERLLYRARASPIAKLLPARATSRRLASPRRTRAGTDCSVTDSQCSSTMSCCSRDWMGLDAEPEDNDWRSVLPPADACDPRTCGVQVPNLDTPAAIALGFVETEEVLAELRLIEARRGVRPSELRASLSISAHEVRDKVAYYTILLRLGSDVKPASLKYEGLVEADGLPSDPPQPAGPAGAEGSANSPATGAEQPGPAPHKKQPPPPGLHMSGRAAAWNALLLQPSQHRYSAFLQLRDELVTASNGKAEFQVCTALAACVQQSAAAPHGWRWRVHKKRIQALNKLLPPKRWLSSLTAEVLAERQLGLAAWLEAVSLCWADWEHQETGEVVRKAAPLALHPLIVQFLGARDAIETLPWRYVPAILPPGPVQAAECLLLPEQGPADDP